MIPEQTIISMKKESTIKILQYNLFSTALNKNLGSLATSSDEELELFFNYNFDQLVDIIDIDLKASVADNMALNNLKIVEASAPSDCSYQKNIRRYISCPHCNMISCDCEQVDINDAYNNIVKEMCYIYKDNWKEILYNTSHLSENLICSSEKKCPYCKKTLDDSLFFKISLKDEKPHFNAFLNDYVVERSDNRITCKVSFNTFHMNIPSKRVEEDTYIMSIDFDLLSGRTFILPITDTHGNKKVISTFPEDGMECTFSDLLCSKTPYTKGYEAVKTLVRVFDENEIHKEIFLLMATHLNIIKRHALKWADDCFGLNRLRCLCLLNRCPMINISSIVGLANIDDKLLPVGDLLSDVTKKYTSSNVISLITSKICNSSSKKIRTFIINDITKCVDINFFYKLGFSSLSLLEEFCAISASTNIDKNYCLNNVAKHILKASDSFYSDLIGVMGEKKALSIIKKNNRSHLIDAAIMYEFVKKQKNSEMNLKTIFNGDAEDIRRHLIYLSKSAFPLASTIQYSQEEIKKYEKNIETLSFSLIQDSDEIFDVDRYMHNNLSKHKNEILNKDIYAVIARDIDAQPVLCILIKDNNVIFARSLFDSLVQGDYALCLHQWLEAVNVNYYYCHDCKHILNGNIQYQENPYATLIDHIPPMLHIMTQNTDDSGIVLQILSQLPSKYRANFA